MSRITLGERDAGFSPISARMTAGPLWWRRTPNAGNPSFETIEPFSTIDAPSGISGSAFGTVNSVSCGELRVAAVSKCQRLKNVAKHWTLVLLVHVGSRRAIDQQAK